MLWRPAHTPPISHVGGCFVSTRYDPEFDSEFGQSFAGLAWPRAAVAGGSLWNYEPTLDPTSTQFAALVTNHNNRLATRVGANVTCPNGCTCDWNSRCVWWWCAVCGKCAYYYVFSLFVRLIPEAHP